MKDEILKKHPTPWRAVYYEDGGFWGYIIQDANEKCVTADDSDLEVARLIANAVNCYAASLIKFEGEEPEDD